MSDKTSLTADYANRTDLVTTSDLTTFVNNNSGIVSGTVQNTTSGAVIDFTSIPSWVKRITVMFNSVSTNGASNWLVQLGTSSGIETSGYSSYSSLGGHAATSTSGNIFNSGSAGNTVTGTFIFTTLGNNAWINTHTLANPIGPTASIGGGTKTLPGVLDRIRVTTVNGTDQFDAGQIGLLYE